MALPFEVGPANNTRGFRSADGPRPQMCLFGGSADRPCLQKNLRIRVRGYPRPQSAHLWRAGMSVLLNFLVPATVWSWRLYTVVYMNDRISRMMFAVCYVSGDAGVRPISPSGCISVEGLRSSSTCQQGVVGYWTHSRVRHDPRRQLPGSLLRISR